MKKIIIALLLLICSRAEAQQQDTLVADIDSNKRIIVKLNVPYLSAGAEIKLKNSFTLFVQVGFPFNIVYGDWVKTQLVLTPFVHGGFRYYHNLKKRNEKGKRTEGFFANYIALRGYFPLAQPDVSVSGAFLAAASYVGLHYGLQRKFLKNWYWDVNAGYGIGYFVGAYNPQFNFFFAVGYTF